MRANPKSGYLAIWLLVLGCVYPTERSGDLRVVMDSIPRLLDNESDTLSARVVDEAGNVIEDIPISFSSSNPAVVAIVGTFLVASGPGEAEISASAVGYEGSAPAVQLVTVQDEVAIDSMLPRVLSYGDTIRLFGVGLGPAGALQYLLDDVPVPFASWSPEDPLKPERFGVLSLYAAPPARASVHGVVVTFNGSATSPDVAAILPRDIYEPNDTEPWDFGAIDSVSNPALAFEARPRSDVAIDWYRFTNSVPRDRTVRVESKQLTTLVYRPILTDSVAWDPAALEFRFGPQAWAVGQGFLMCHGIPLNIPFLPGSGFSVSFQGLGAGTYDLVNVYSAPGGYSLTISDSYDSDRQMDPAEENDICDLATPLGLNARRVLSIDNPYDPDWFAFSVNTATTINLDLQVIAGGGGFIEPDLDLFLLRSFPDSLMLIANTADGATDATSATIPPGDYFVLITDFAGVTAAYTLDTSSSPAPPGAVFTEPTAIHRATGAVPVPLPPAGGSSR